MNLIPRIALGLALGLSAQALPVRAQEQQQLDTIEQQIESSKQSESRIASEIAAAINRLLGDDALRQRLEHGGLAYAEANSWTTRAAQFQSLCHRLAGE